MRRPLAVAILFALGALLMTGLALGQVGQSSWTSRTDSYQANQATDGGWRFTGTTPTAESAGIPLTRATMPATAYRVTSVCPFGTAHVTGMLLCYFRSQALSPAVWVPCDPSLNVSVPPGRRIYTTPDLAAHGYGSVDYVAQATCSGTPDGGMTPDGGTTGYRALEVMYGR